MAWTIELSPDAEDDLARLDRPVARRIRNALASIAELPSPRERGKALTGPLGEFWSYRIGDYRALCRIDDEQITVLVVKIDHRSSVYRTRR